MSRAVGAALALVAAAGPVACGGVPDGQPLPELEEVETAAGARYAVACHFPCGGVAPEALRVADLAWEGVAVLFPLPDSVASPMTLRLYRAEAFREVALALTRDHLEEGAAFSSPQRRTAYIELIPQVSEASLLRDGLPAPTLRLVAHEAAHLAIAAAAGGAPRLPDWLSEGAALAVERDVAARLRLYAGTLDPRFAAQTWRTYSLMRTGLAPSLAALLSEPPDVAAGRADYAVRALAFEFLRAELPGTWSRLLEVAGRQLGDPGLADSLTALAAEELGAAGGADRVDASFRAHVARAAEDIGWLELRGLPREGEALAHAGLPGGRVTVLAVDPWREESLEVRGTLEFAGGTGEGAGDGLVRREPGARGAPSGALGVFVAGDAEARLVVAFDYREGRVTVRREARFAGAPGTGDGIAEAVVELPRSHGFSIRLHAGDVAGPGTLEVRIDGARILATEVADGDARGDWGVVAEPGASGVWRGLVARR
jgi:hypothetical protein